MEYVSLSFLKACTFATNPRWIYAPFNNLFILDYHESVILKQLQMNITRVHLLFDIHHGAPKTKQWCFVLPPCTGGDKMDGHRYLYTAKGEHFSMANFHYTIFKTTVPIEFNKSWWQQLFYCNKNHNALQVHISLVYIFLGLKNMDGLVAETHLIFMKTGQPWHTEEDLAEAEELQYGQANRNNKVEREDQRQ
ncbi:hypothetical protein BCR42DRAFT_431017 [Absidia repens]|uniref:Uncharacterized protein n=1 Tax=Absidia repens TaxID=90262 RepID=A0A1X2J0P0_9FUNG|nr:hypothetical protein BCR42DRAFT_431017 [Absidia repens]